MDVFYKTLLYFNLYTVFCEGG